LLPFFGLTLFISAALLFFVQPMIGKMILPRLGGTPAVWNTCMVFFQAMLLVGYTYTHTLTTTLTRRSQLLVQSCLLFTPFLFLMLPFTIGDDAPPTEDNPVFWLLWLLLGVVGLPFFVIATSAPLLQKWFASTGHRAARDPYFLYGASNLGSMLGLLLYPALFEPMWDLETQSLVWSVGYGIAVALIVGCAIMVWRTAKLTPEIVGPPVIPEPLAAVVQSSPGVPDTAVTSTIPARRDVKLPAVAVSAVTASPAPAASRRGVRLPVSLLRPPSSARAGQGGSSDSWLFTFLFAKNEQAVVPYSDTITLGRRLRWILLAAVPSSLMLGVTTYLTTDIAAVPFFWVVPLALYLLTFILVFARWPVVWTDMPHTVILYLQPCALLFLVLRMVAHLTDPIAPWGDFFLNLAAFFTTALLCHGELAKDRPSARHLTEFYLWMSVGGVLGGMFNALAAPMLLPYLMHLQIPLAGGVSAWIRVPVSWFNTLVGDVPMLYGIVEYPLAMVVGCLLRPYMAQDVSQGRDIGLPKRPVDAAGTAFDVLLFGLGMTTYSAGMRKRAARQPGLAGFGTASLGALRRLWPSSNLVEIFLDLAIPIAFAVFAWVLVDVGDRQHALLGLTIRRSYLMMVAVVVALAMAMRPVRFGLSVGLLFVVVGLFDRAGEQRVYEDRGFFGLLRVRQSDEAGGKVRRTLIHGGINHGQQLIWPPAWRRQPITYFHPSNGIGEVFHKLTWGNPPSATAAPEDYEAWMKQYQKIKYHFFPADSRLPASLVGLGAVSPWAQLVGTQQQVPYAVVGLGTGTLAAHAQPYQHVDFFEIDPMVKRLSVPPPGGSADDLIFYYVDDALLRGAQVDIKLGDGRLKIKEAPENYYHAITLDAFSSDAIPVHLLTRDAVEEYIKHLADGGVLIFNTTNRYVHIQPVLAAIAAELDMECLACPDWSDEEHPEKYGADWIVLRRKDKALDEGTYLNGGPSLHQRLDLVDRWKEVEPLPGRAWTDKYSNLLRVMRW
jgi:SAM-dependent methyltransferase